MKTSRRIRSERPVFFNVLLIASALFAGSLAYGAVRMGEVRVAFWAASIALVSCLVLSIINTNFNVEEE